MCPQPIEPTVSWAASKEAWPAVEGGDTALLLCSDKTSFGVLHRDVKFSVQERQVFVGAFPEKARKNDPRDVISPLRGQAE